MAAGTLIRTAFFSLAAAALSSIGGSAFAQESFRSARVSDVRGDLAVRNEQENEFEYLDLNAVLRESDTLWTDESSRAEFELPGGSWLRLAQESKLELLRLERGSAVRLWSGSLYADLSERFSGALRVQTPAGDIDILRDSVVRIDLSSDDRARVSVWYGQAEIFPEQGPSLRLRGGERSYLDPRGSLARPERFQRDDLDAFDAYHRERVDYYVTRPLPSELGGDLIGGRELAGYGEWIDYDNERYWRPSVPATWRPYSAGYWSFIPGAGYSWIDPYPWAYTTCHYGRWLYRPTFGWMWSPGSRWGANFVFWGSFGNNYGWAPLDPWDRPCYWGGGSFLYPGLNVVIDARSFTFCDRNTFYQGGRHWFGGGRNRLLFSGYETGLNVGGFRHISNADREFNQGPRIRGTAVLPGGRAARRSVLRVENDLPEQRLQRIERKFGVPGDRDRRLAVLPGGQGQQRRTEGVARDGGDLKVGRDGVRGEGGRSTGRETGDGRPGGRILPGGVDDDSRRREAGGGRRALPGGRDGDPDLGGGRSRGTLLPGGGDARVLPDSPDRPVRPEDRAGRARERAGDKDRDNPFRRGGLIAPGGRSTTGGVPAPGTFRDFPSPGGGPRTVTPGRGGVNPPHDVPSRRYERPGGEATSGRSPNFRRESSPSRDGGGTVLPGGSTSPPSYGSPPSGGGSSRYLPGGSSSRPSSGGSSRYEAPSGGGGRVLPGGSTSPPSYGSPPSSGGTSRYLPGGSSSRPSSGGSSRYEAPSGGGSTSRPSYGPPPSSGGSSRYLPGGSSSRPSSGGSSRYEAPSGGGSTSRPSYGSPPSGGGASRYLPGGSSSRPGSSGGGSPSRGYLPSRSGSSGGSSSGGYSPRSGSSGGSSRPSSGGGGGGGGKGGGHKKDR